MKTRIGFVSNSSSTSFTIRNRTGAAKTLVDFVKENPQIIEQFNAEYDYKYTLEDVLHDAEADNQKWSPNEDRVVTFGDEDGTTIGHIFDYALRDGGESDSFEWRFYEYQR